MQPHCIAHLPCPLRALQPAAHQQSAPTVRARIGKHAEGRVPLQRMLSAREEAEPAVQVQVQGGGMGERRGVELELEDLPACAAPGMQPPQTQRLCKADPIRVGGNGGGHGLSAPGSAPDGQAHRTSIDVTVVPSLPLDGLRGPETRMNTGFFVSAHSVCRHFYRQKPSASSGRKADSGCGVRPREPFSSTIGASHSRYFGS